MASKTAAPDSTKEAWLEIEAKAVARRITQEGVTPDRAERIIEKYKDKVVSGVPPRYAEAHLKPEVLRAKRESEIDGLVKSLAERFHLPVETVESVVSKAIVRLHANPRLLVQVVVREHEPKLRKLSDEAYIERRTTKSPMAAALVKSGVVPTPKARTHNPS